MDARHSCLAKLNAILRRYPRQFGEVSRNWNAASARHRVREAPHLHARMLASLRGQEARKALLKLRAGVAVKDAQLSAEKARARQRAVHPNVQTRLQEEGSVRRAGAFQNSNRARASTEYKNHRPLG